MVGVEYSFLFSPDADRQRMWNCRCRFVACVPANPFIASHGYARLLAYPVRNRQPSLTVDPMKTKASKITEGSARKLSSILAVVCIFLGLSELAQAQEGTPPPLATLFWDGPDEVGNGHIDGGTGTWDLTRTNWTNLVSGMNSAWVQGS